MGPKPSPTTVISINTVIFEQGFTVLGSMYANLPSYRCYLPDYAGPSSHPPPPGPQAKWLLIGAQKTATMATSCLANSLLEDVEGGEVGL